MGQAYLLMKRAISSNVRLCDNIMKNLNKKLVKALNKLILASNLVIGFRTSREDLEAVVKDAEDVLKDIDDLHIPCCLAEQQITGWECAKNGGSISDLVSEMGMTEEELDYLVENNELEWLTDDLIVEMYEQVLPECSGLVGMISSGEVIDCFEEACLTFYNSSCGAKSVIEGLVDLGYKNVSNEQSDLHLSNAFMVNNKKMIYGLDGPGIPSHVMQIKGCEFLVIANNCFGSKESKDGD